MYLGWPCIVFLQSEHFGMVETFLQGIPWAIKAFLLKNVDRETCIKPEEGVGFR